MHGGIGNVKKAIGNQQITLAKDAGVITAAEAKKLMAYDKKLMDIIHVDHFEEKELIRTKPPAKKKAAVKKTPVKKSAAKKAPAKKVTTKKETVDKEGGE